MNTERLPATIGNLAERESQTEAPVTQTPGGLPRRDQLRLAGRVLPKRRDSKRDALLVAAREEFAASGFLGTHIVVIAQRVGIRKSTFFHYFEDKESLYDAAIGELLDDLVRALDASVENLNAFGERLDALTDCLQQHVEVEASMSRLLLRGLVDLPPPGTPRPTAMERIVDRFVETLLLGVREGRVVQGDCAQRGVSVVALICSLRTGATPLQLRETEPLIGVTAAMRAAEVRAQVRRFLGVR